VREKAREKERLLKIEKMPPPPKPEDENPFKKKTPFLMRYRFRNRLPPIPFDPKMLAVPQDKERLWRYVRTNFERRSAPSLIPEADLGIPLDLVDLEGYAPRPGAVMDPKDAAILDVDKCVKRIAAAKHGGEGPIQYTWLRPNTYLSNDLWTSTYSRGDDRDEAVMRHGLAMAADSPRGDGAAGGAASNLEEQKRRIAASFDFWKDRTTLEHPTKKGVFATSILEIQPDIERWHEDYSLVTFSSNPAPQWKDAPRYETGEAPILVPVEAEEARYGRREIFTYLTPVVGSKRTVREMLADGTEDPSSEHQATEYHLQTEHIPTVRYFPPNSTLVLYTTESGVKYKAISKAYNLHKTKLKPGSYPKPVDITAKVLDQQPRAVRRKIQSTLDSLGIEVEE
jgi:hypothetical protein